MHVFWLDILPGLTAWYWLSLDKAKAYMLDKTGLAASVEQAKAISSQLLLLAINLQEFLETFLSHLQIFLWTLLDFYAIRKGIDGWLDGRAVGGQTKRKKVRANCLAGNSHVGEVDGRMLGGQTSIGWKDERTGKQIGRRGYWMCETVVRQTRWRVSRLSSWRVDRVLGERRAVGRRAGVERTGECVGGQVSGGRVSDKWTADGRALGRRRAEYCRWLGEI